MKAIKKRNFQGGIKPYNHYTLECFPGIVLTKLYCGPGRSRGERASNTDTEVVQGAWSSWSVGSR